MLAQMTAERRLVCGQTLMLWLLVGLGYTQGW